MVSTATTVRAVLGVLALVRVRLVTVMVGGGRHVRVFAARVLDCLARGRGGGVSARMGMGLGFSAAGMSMGM